MLTAATGTDWTAIASPTTVSLANSPAGVLVTRDGNWVLAASIGSTADGGNSGELDVLKRSGATLTFDHSIAAPDGQIAFGLAVSPDGTTLAMGMGNEVGLYDLAKVETDPTHALLGYVTTNSSAGVSIDVVFSRDGKLLFVANEYDNDVAVIDVAKRAYVGAIPIAGYSVAGLAVSPDGTKLYVVCEMASEFAAANPNPAEDQFVGKLTVASVAMAAFSPGSAVLGQAFVGRSPVRVAVSADGATIWVTARGSNALIALDAATLLSKTCSPLLASIAVGPAPVGLNFVDQGKVVAVADSNRWATPQQNETVAFVDANAKKLLGHVTVGMFPREIDDDATALFVSDFNSNAISGVDLTKLTLP